MTTARQVKQLVEGQEDVVAQLEEVTKVIREQTGLVDDLLGESAMTQEGILRILDQGRVATRGTKLTHEGLMILMKDIELLYEEIAEIRTQQALTNMLLTALLLKSPTVVAG